MSSLPLSAKATSAGASQDTKVPYGSFNPDARKQGTAHAGLDREDKGFGSRSFSFGLPFSSPRALPLDRYGLISDFIIKHTRPNIGQGTPGSAVNKTQWGEDMERDLTKSAPQQPLREGDPVQPFVLPPRSDSTFQSIIEIAIDSVQLPVGKCSVRATVFNMANCLVGSGILGLPFSLAVGGWCGLLVMLLATIGTSYTGKIIGRCIEHILDKYTGDTQRGTYQDIAELSCQSRWLGKLFKYTINLSIVLELWGGACSRIILQGSNLHKVFPSYSEHFFMALCAAILVPSVFMDMEKLSILSMLGLTSSCLLLVGVLVAGSERGIAEDTELVKLEGLPITFGIILFSYSGHAVFPQIYRAMEDPHEYSSSVDTAFYVSFAFYAVMAAGGYLFWGGIVMDQITLNLPAGWFADTVILLVVLNTMLSYPLIMLGPIETIELGLNITSMENRCLRELLQIIVRTILVAGTLVVALTITNFALIATFIGAVFTMGVSLIFPCIIYLKMMHFGLPPKLRESQGLETSEIAWNIFLILLGLLGMFTGVWQGINQLT